MYRFIILMFLLPASVIVVAQSPIQKNKTVVTPVQKVKLTIEQTKWLNANYKRLGRLDKNSATTFIKTMPDLTSMNEGVFEFLISHFTKLVAEESSMQKQLELLKSEKQALQNKIQSEQNKWENTTDTIKKQKLLDGIRLLSAELELINREIKRLEAKINLMLKNAFLL